MTTHTMVRVYVTEGRNLEHAILAYLHNEIHIRGVTVFRGITGFGHSGEMHDSKLLYMSMDLPIVIEFFDEASKVETALAYLVPLVGEGRIVSWQISAH